MSKIFEGKTSLAFMEIQLMMMADEINFTVITGFVQTQKWSKVKKPAYTNF